MEENKKLNLEIDEEDFELEKDIIDEENIELEIAEDFKPSDKEKEASYYNEDGVAAYLKDIQGYKILSKEEVTQLVKEMNAGDVEAKNKIVTHNLKLAFHVAKKYKGRGVPLLDLVQEANLGLVKAVEKFQPEKGYAFSTYALWWASATVRRYLQENHGNIRIPNYVNERIYKVDKVAKAFEADGTVATPEDIAATLDVSVEDVKHAMRSRNISSVLSLDFSPEESDSLSNLVSDESQNVEAQFVKEESSKALVDVIRKVCKDEREVDIILRSFGFYGEKNTLEEIGEIYGITKERVRQIKDRTIKRFQSIVSTEKSDKTDSIKQALISIRN